jgi:hypothetical protein
MRLAMRLASWAVAALCGLAVWLFVHDAHAQAPGSYAPPAATPYAAPAAPTPAPPAATTPAPPATAAAEAAAPPAAPVADPHEDVLRRLLRSGCRDGIAEARALAASGAASWAETVTRLCVEILRAHPGPAARVILPHHERDGRGTLVIASTIYGIWAGVAVDVLASINSARTAIIPPLLGMGAGLALSLGLTSDRPVSAGQAWSIVTGFEYGSFNGALWAGSFDLSSQQVVGTALGTGLAAGAAGIVVANLVVPTQGDVEVVRSGLLWGTAAGMLGVLAVDSNVSSTTFLKVSAVSMDLGFIAGLAVASSFPISRNRDLIIDAGTLGGGVAGLGIAVLVMGTNGSGRAVAAGGLAGMLTGMLATIFLTRDMDKPEDDDQSAPVAALVGRDARGRWRWGTPGAAPVFDGLGRRVVGATLTAFGGAL